MQIFKVHFNVALIDIYGHVTMNSSAIGGANFTLRNPEYLLLLRASSSLLSVPEEIVI